MQVENSETKQVKSYISTILNTYIPERTKFYRISNNCFARDLDGEFKTSEAIENCYRQAWAEASIMLPNLYSFVGGEPYAKTFNSIPVPAPMATFARTENSSLYYRSLCEESRARLLNGEKIYGFSFDECSSNAFKLFEQAQDELIKMKKKYGL